MRTAIKNNTMAPAVVGHYKLHATQETFTTDHKRQQNKKRKNRLPQHNHLIQQSDVFQHANKDITQWVYHQKQQHTAAEAKVVIHVNNPSIYYIYLTIGQTMRN